MATKFIKVEYNSNDHETNGFCNKISIEVFYNSHSEYGINSIYNEDTNKEMKESDFTAKELREIYKLIEVEVNETIINSVQ